MRPKQYSREVGIWAKEARDLFEEGLGYLPREYLQRVQTLDADRLRLAQVVVRRAGNLKAYLDFRFVYAGAVNSLGHIPEVLFHLARSLEAREHLASREKKGSRRKK